MTEVNKFVDRRTEEERRNGLATQILFWYDDDVNKSWRDKNGQKQFRRRTNGITVNAAGNLIVARSTCSRMDQFVRAMGRLKVASRIFGNAKNHCWTLVVDLTVADLPTAFAAVYADTFPNDEMGAKRAYNIGKVFARSRSN
jgi:hypothetical protein